MKILHILKSDPDSNVEKLMDVITDNNEAKVQALYNDDINWSTLVDDIFSHDKVICWW
jgi:hypothetical protein